MKKLLTLAIVGIFLTACQQATQETTNTPTDTEQTQEAMQQTDGTQANEATDGAMMEDEQAETDDAMEQAADVTIEMSNYEFSPATLSGEPGETITVELVNNEGFHDLVIDELNVASSKIEEGETETIEITIPEDAQSGDEYAYYCSVGNHRALGMEGTLSVE